jgi:hypothetical protein
MSLTYISGPPCSGKSVVCQSFLEDFPELVCISGDTYWMQNDGMSFRERVLQTNELILQDLRKRTEGRLLLEWVPATGSFRESLQGICASQGRSFHQIILYADADELKKRKRARDGDEDIVEPAPEEFATLEEALVVDTTGLSKSDLGETCVKWLRLRL